MEPAGDFDRAQVVGPQLQPATDERRVARHVLRVPLRIAVLRIDGRDETLQDVEADGRGRLVLPFARSSDSVTAARLGLLEDTDGGGKERRGRRRVVGIGRQADAHGDGKSLGLVEAEAEVDQGRAQPVDQRLESGHGGSREAISRNSSGP